MPLNSDDPLARDWSEWLANSALPLWGDAGFDRGRALYRERLGFDAQPIEMPALRLMVQARQVATFCRAASEGLYAQGAHSALACLAESERRFRAVDDEPGWIFSVAADGEPADRTRDLYTHAFVLFAYAWAHFLTRDPAYLASAKETAVQVERLFATDTAGYVDVLPQTETVFRQNPHMHLLESHLALFEVSQDAFYLDRASAIVDLALDRFIDPVSGLLPETFDLSWKPLVQHGAVRVEPGHQFEWAWLLLEFLRLAPSWPRREEVRAAANRLHEGGRRFGLSPATGEVWDAIDLCGGVLHRSTRAWPQTEYIRLVRHVDLGLAFEDGDHARLTDAILTRFVPASLRGGWIDRFDGAGMAAVDHMPASTLYHVYGALRLFR